MFTYTFSNNINRHLRNITRWFVKIKNNRKFSFIILALNAMKTSVDSIEKDSNNVIVLALITGPIVS